MSIVLYGFRNSPSYRAVLLTARAIGLRLQEKHVDLRKNEHKTDAYLKMNPTHTVPTLDDKGFYIWESRAIMGYLVHRYGADDRLYPKDPAKKALVDNMLYYDASCLGPGLWQFAAPIRFLGKPPNPVTKGIFLERLGFLDTILKNRIYAAGDVMTIADIGLVTSVAAVEGENIGVEHFSRIEAWRSRVKGQLPFYEEVTKGHVEN